MKNYQQLLEQTADGAKREEADLKEALEEEEAKLVEALNQYRERCVRMEQDIKSKEAALSDNIRSVGRIFLFGSNSNARFVLVSIEWLCCCPRELSEVERKLEAMEESSRQMSGLEKELADAQQLYDQTEQGVNADEIEQEIGLLK